MKAGWNILLIENDGSFGVHNPSFSSGVLGAARNELLITDFSTPNGNTPPIADAGPDQTVNVGVLVTLDGSNSSDPDTGIASYLWEQTGGASVTLSDPTAVQPTFTAPDLGAEGGALTFQLTVTDNGGLQSTDTCVVNVPGLAP